jgi:hypothetical protein
MIQEKTFDLVDYDNQYIVDYFSSYQELFFWDLLDLLKNPGIYFFFGIYQDFLIILRIQEDLIFT